MVGDFANGPGIFMGPRVWLWVRGYVFLSVCMSVKCASVCKCASLVLRPLFNQRYGISMELKDVKVRIEKIQ